MDKPLNVESAAEYLDISKSHLYKLISNRRIPHYKPNGKRVYLYQSDLDDYIKSGAVKTRDEINKETADRIVTEGA